MDNDTREDASALYDQAIEDIRVGNNITARIKLEQALIIRNLAGERAFEAVILARLAALDLLEEDRSAARKKLLQTIEIYRDMKDMDNEAKTWQSIAAVEFLEGN